VLWPLTHYCQSILQQNQSFNINFTFILQVSFFYSLQVSFLVELLRLLCCQTPAADGAHKLGDPFKAKLNSSRSNFFLCVSLDDMFFRTLRTQKMLGANRTDVIVVVLHVVPQVVSSGEFSWANVAFEVKNLCVQSYVLNQLVLRLESFCTMEALKQFIGVDLHVVLQI